MKVLFNAGTKLRGHVQSHLLCALTWDNRISEPCMGRVRKLGLPVDWRPQMCYIVEKSPRALLLCSSRVSTANIAMSLITDWISGRSSWSESSYNGKQDSLYCTSSLLRLCLRATEGSLAHDCDLFFKWWRVCSLIWYYLRSLDSRTADLMRDRFYTHKTFQKK